MKTYTEKESGKEIKSKKEETRDWTNKWQYGRGRGKVRVRKRERESLVNVLTWPAPLTLALALGTQQMPAARDYPQKRDRPSHVTGVREVTGHHPCLPAAAGRNTTQSALNPIHHTISTPHGPAKGTRSPVTSSFQGTLPAKNWKSLEITQLANVLRVIKKIFPFKLFIPQSKWASTAGQE